MLPWVGVNLREFYYGIYFTVGATAVQARPIARVLLALLALPRKIRTFLPVAAERYRKNATKGLTPFGNLFGLYVTV